MLMLSEACGRVKGVLRRLSCGRRRFNRAWNRVAERIADAGGMELPGPKECPVEDAVEVHADKVRRGLGARRPFL